MVREPTLDSSIRQGAMALAAVALLAGCGASRDKAATQTAAKVDKQEITVHQINFVLQQQRNLRPEQADAAGKQILERLIDQELALQKAEDLKIDRDPRVVQQLEAAKREIVARAYLERVGEAASKPTLEEISAYYRDKPALFAERRIYNLQEIAIEAKPEQGAVLRDKLGAAKNVQEFIDFLRANDFRFAGNQAVRAAEQLPLASLNTFARLQDGQALINPSANGFQVIVLAGSRSQPVTEEQARPAIEQFILNERKRKLMDDDMKQLRANAKVEYVGKFAPGPGDAGTARAAGAAGAGSAAAGADMAAPAAPAPAPAPAAAPAASSALSPADVTRGLGIK
jgi:EpsD family peptidyl-prolyl cis-trans isomerase